MRASDSDLSVRVWDPFVRVFHWSLVSCVVLNFFVVDDGETLHQFIGYLAAGLVAARFVWGFVGSGYARFDSFFPTPAGCAPTSSRCGVASIRFSPVTTRSGR
ncbi:MAG: hypothetical protein AB7S63_11980 [Thauera sp.]|jgi:cytochrome b